MSIVDGQWVGPILDDHFHLNRKGRFIAAAQDFANSGGTHLILVHCPDFANLPTTAAEYSNAYADTVAMAEKVRREVELDVRVMLGPHPAAFAHQCLAWEQEDGEPGAERAMELYHESITEALKFIHEGKAVGLGEVGRPHWQVSASIWERSNALLGETLAIAAREGVPCQLHVEGDESAPYADIAPMADRAGLARKRLVRHFAPPDVSDELTRGMVPSVILQKGGIDTLIATIERCSGGFMLETDHMDDPRRPGAVLGPKTVPKRTQALVAAGVDEEVLYRTHVDLPNSIYGID
jgi:TatD-related deoxyribonuclease